jgi:hypothetical protein
MVNAAAGFLAITGAHKSGTSFKEFQRARKIVITALTPRSGTVDRYGRAVTATRISPALNWTV